jgi:hypothetical protein
MISAHFSAGMAVMVHVLFGPEHIYSDAMIKAPPQTEKNHHHPAPLKLE